MKRFAKLCEQSGTRLQGTNVDSANLAAVAGVGLGVKRDLLTLGEGLEALGDDRGEVDENILAAIVVGNKAEALFRIEPFYGTLIHLSVPPLLDWYPPYKKTHMHS